MDKYGENMTNTHPLGKMCVEISSVDICKLVTEKLNNEGHKVEEIVIEIDRDIDPKNGEWTNELKGFKVYIK